MWTVDAFPPLSNTMHATIPSNYPQVPLLAEYKEHHTDMSVHFIVEVLPGKMPELQVCVCARAHARTGVGAQGGTHPPQGPGVCMHVQQGPQDSQSTGLCLNTLAVDPEPVRFATLGGRPRVQAEAVDQVLNGQHDAVRPGRNDQALHVARAHHRRLL